MFNPPAPCCSPFIASFSLFGASLSCLFASLLSACPASFLLFLRWLALLCLSSCRVLLWSWVWCLVFLAVDWSRIACAVPLQFVCFLFLFVCVPSLAIANRVITTEYHNPRKDSSVVFLAVDWSGVSPCWPPIHTISALFLAVDWSRDFAT